ncbi:MAG: AsmA-like C-terminal domain-containing protein [Phycisphaerales bacterium]|nr:AsmA-like C-terminal domain-containing protein [Phycisphaerales bacterium]MCB9855892.1 AsmA-like C-terminal domain-containing protein [Phycisphaerales bacterium]
MRRSTIEQHAALRSIREYVHTRTLVRYPVSTFRRRLGVFLLACFVLAFGLYTFSTTDDAIRERALEFLRKATPGGVEIDVGGASFEMFKGITLRDVHVYVPFDERVDPAARKRSEREIFSATTLQLVHDPWLLLFGNLRVKRILAVEPTIVLTNNAETGARNWELLNDPHRDRSRVKLRHRPIVTIRSASAKVISIGKDGKHTESMQILDADVRPAPQSGTGYDIEIRQYRDPIGRATVHFDPAEGMVANSPFVATRTIKLQLPAPLQSLFDSLDVEGDVRLKRFVFDKTANADRDTRIEMRDVRCHVPLWLLFSEQRPVVEDTASQDLNLSLVDLENLDGRVELVGDEIRIDLTGVMNGAPCSVRGTLVRAGDDFKSMGVDLRITAEGFAAPEGAVRNRLLADERAPLAIHAFIEDYDPHGRLDVDLQFTRATNATGTLRMDGSIVPQGVTGAATWFPFALDDVYGAVRFDGPIVYLENLHGRHGSGLASISGTIDRHTEYSSLLLDIESYNVPLDVHLFMAMSERYQGVWKKFMPYGTANIHAVLTRTGGPKSEPRPKLTKHITVDLRDVIAMFRPYPYRIENVDGRLVVDEDRILLRDITGFANGAPILLDGYALLEPDREPEIDMRLAAQGVGLDARVAAAFGGPDGPLARFNPRGVVDLVGGLSRRENDEDLRWDLHVDGRELRIKHDDFPYALTDVSADVDVRTDDVVVNQLNGRHGTSLVNATASWARRSVGDRVEVNVSSNDLLLDGDLYAALPAGVKSTWDMFAPTGRVRVRSQHIFDGDGDSRTHQHTTHIEPIDLAVRFRSLPMPITGLTGAVDVTATEVRIANVRGNIGGSQLLVDGVVHLSDSGMQGELKLLANDIAVTPEVLAALPKGLGDWMKKAKLSGRVSLDFSRLAFQADALGRLRWQIDGRVGLAGVSARLEMELDDADGTISGTCVIEPGGQIQFDADARISRIQFGGWDMRDVRGRVVSDPSAGALMIEKGVARLYGGDATGDAQILFDNDRTSYEASLLFRDVQIGDFIDAQKDKGLRPDARTAPKEKAKGTIAGNFAMRGETGRRAYREGAGTVYIRDAQVWKIPFALAIFQVLNLTPDENVFHDGRIEMFLTDQKLILHKIDLQGKAMAFIGGGTLNLDSNDLDIRLLAASPVRVQVPLLTEILEGVAREAMELHVTGTIDNPRIRPEPLRQARDVIGTLFPEIPRTRR